MAPITFTEKAVQEIKTTIVSKNIPSDYGLRVGVRGGGCAGLTFIIGFDKKNSNDLAFEAQGIQVYVEKKDVMHLIGMEVDFYEGMDARGFIFINPNEKEQTFH